MNARTSTWALIAFCVCDAGCTFHPPPHGNPSPSPCPTMATPATVTLPNPAKRNGEFTVAFDPRTAAQQGNQNLVYAAGQELTLGDLPFPSCIVAKKSEGPGAR